MRGREWLKKSSLPKVHRTAAGASAIVGTGADATLYTFTIPANNVGAGKGMRVSAGFLHGLGSASITYKLILGSTTVCSYSASGSTATESWQFEIINNPGIQNAQTASSTVSDWTGLRA